LIRKILYLLSGKERQRLAGLIGGNVVISIVDIASLGLLLYIVGFYTRQQAKAPPAFLPEWLMDKNSLALIGLFALFFLLKSVMGYFILQAQYKFVFQVASRISETNMLQYLEGGYPEYVQVDASVHIRKISQQPIEFCQYVLAGCQQIITEGVLVTLTVLGIILFNVKLFFLLGLLLMPAIFLLAGFSRRKLKLVRRDIKNSGEKSLQYLREALTGFVESNLYEKNAFFSQRYAGYQRILNNHISELQIVQGIPSRMIEVFAVLGLFILIAFGKWSGDGGTVAFVTLGAFLAAAYKIIPGMVKILNISGQVKTYQFTVEDLYRDARKEPLPVPGPPPLSLTSLAFSGVEFSQQQGRILQGLDFCLRRGELLGLSGSSGRGKTTIVNLLLGFLAPGEGRILINDRVTDTAGRRQYWGRIAYVKQQPFLLHDTVLKNITLTDGAYDEDRLNEIIRITGLERVGGEGADALTRMITENGKNISGGQRQRIAFARALYKEADLLILDEPFSELDEEAEREMLDYCLQLAQQGKAILLITHNKKNLSLCHKTILLDEE
jgi:ABC-type multidrug transport system fused ATPase/permease subunit